MPLSNNVGIYSPLVITMILLFFSQLKQAQNYAFFICRLLFTTHHLNNANDTDCNQALLTNSGGHLSDISIICAVTFCNTSKHFHNVGVMFYQCSFNDTAMHFTSGNNRILLFLKSNGQVQEFQK